MAICHELGRYAEIAGTVFQFERYWQAGGSVGFMKKKYLILLLALALTACGEAQTEVAETTSRMKVNVVQVQPTQLNYRLLLSGSIQAKDDVSVGTPLQGLQVLDVKAEVGDWVEQGQVLATLEQSQVQSQFRQNDALLQRAKANLVSQQSTLKEAEATLKRYQQLIKTDAVSRQELDQQRAKAESARAAIQVAKAEIAQVQAQLDDSRHQRKKAEVLAPTSGIVTQRSAQAGNLTDSNALFHIARDGVLEAVVRASADEISVLETGLVANVQMLDKVTSGLIRLISSQIDSATHTAKVHIALQEKLQVPFGTPINAAVQLPEMTAQIAVPFSAVNFGADGNHFVMVVNADGTVVRRKITLGEVSQIQAEVLSGLQVGEQVVQKAGALINEGDQVEAVLSKGAE